ncbi:ABC transporter permease [Roseibacillus persicicus]|uniref:ABC transporter permease subunit n=1 Tax=Roseibacillus persicicus TaxID=454148 RepID=UPI00398A629E
MDSSQDWWKSRDLPERLGPMMTKELRQGLRRGLFLYPFIGIQVFAIAAMAVEFQMNIDDIEKSTEFGGPLNFLMFFPGEMFSGPFWVVVGLICLVMMPLGGLMLMGQELEEGNHELLLMTPLSRWKVVRGKFLTLWGICLLTFSSLLPYAIVRYFIGGIDVGRNISLALTVVLGSGMIASGAIGASSFKGMIARIGVLGLFLGSMALSMMACLMSAGARTGGAGVFFHLNAYGIFFCYTVLGLAMARSRIRLVVHHYEVKPSWMIIGLLFFTPFVIGMAAAVTTGYAGFVGAIGMGFVAWYADVTPKAPSWVNAPVPNVPQPPQLPSVPEEGMDVLASAEEAQVPSSSEKEGD